MLQTPLPVHPPGSEGFAPNVLVTRGFPVSTFAPQPSLHESFTGSCFSGPRQDKLSVSSRSENIIGQYPRGGQDPNEKIKAAD